MAMYYIHMRGNCKGPMMGPMRGVLRTVLLVPFIEIDNQLYHALHKVSETKVLWGILGSCVNLLETVLL